MLLFAIMESVEKEGAGKTDGCIVGFSLALIAHFNDGIM
jgi:hypothetical protein